MSDLGKMIFLDIDGTIQDFDGYIPESAVRAVSQARKIGHKVCISTGRPYYHIEKRILDIGFDGVISGSGSYVVYRGECISHKYFSLMTYLNLADYLRENGCIIELQNHAESFLVKEDKEAFLQIGEKIKKKLGSFSRQLVELPRIINSVMDITEVEKLIFFSNILSNEEIIGKWGKYLHVTPMSVPSSGKWSGEITPISVNKAKGIQSILEVQRCCAEDVIAVGDSENDIEMIRMADIGVAMGNATQAVKREADIVTAPLREGGLAKAFAKLELI